MANIFKKMLHLFISP
jgi:hypothetical protein